MKLSPTQLHALGIADDASDADIAKALKALGLAALSEDAGDDDKNKKTLTPTGATTETPAPPLPVVQPPRDEVGKFQPATNTPATPAAMAPAAVAEDAEPLTPQAVAAAAGGLGLQVVDAVMFAQLQQDAAAGRAARDEQDRVRRDGLVKEAVRKGKIAPGAFAAFRKQADTDESGLVVLLAAMPEILPTQSIGHSEQFTGDTTGSDRVVTDQTESLKRASVFAHFGIPTPDAAKG